jgi:serine/threonine-protein kinase
MAEVYRGYQPALTRDVAIKVLQLPDPQAEGRGRAEFLKLFESEARLVAKLAHPYIVPIYDFGVDREWAYMVMELITHGSVRDEMAKARATRKRVNLDWTLEILDQVATALDFAHMRGVAHLDVKPGNMLLRELNMVVLSDFGVARILAERGMNGGGVMGTPQYMAPEQTRPNAPVDGHADIYALGVVLFECVTGRLPFTGETNQAIMLMHRNAPVPLPTLLEPKTPKAVEAIILKAMAKDPSARYARANDMAQALRQARAELAQSQALSELPTGAQSPTATLYTVATPVIGVAASEIAPIPVPVAAPAQIAPFPAAPYPAQPAPMAPALRPAAAPAPAGPSALPPPSPYAPPDLNAAGQYTPCFRCGTMIPSTVRFCVTCGYDRASTRASADTFQASSGRPLRCRLIFQNGQFAGRALMLHQGVTTIGRGPGNDLLLSDGSVSRMHARLSFARGVWYLEDMGSSNGVFVNRKLVKSQLSLQHGDIVNFGNLEARFEVVN